jgi:hypothetical protein
MMKRVVVVAVAAGLLMVGIAVAKPNRPAVPITLPVERNLTLLNQTLAIALKGEEVGTLTAVDVENDEGVKLRRESTMNITRGATRSTMRTLTTVQLQKNGQAKGYHFERTDPSGTFVMDGVIDGSTLRLTTTQQGASVPSTVALPKGAVMSLAVEHQLRHLGKARAPITQPAILEEMGAVVDLTSSVEVVERGVFRIRTSFSGVETVEDVDASGRTLRSRTDALGVVAYPPGQAPADLGGGSSDLLAVSTWVVERVPRDASAVTYRIETADAAHFDVPQDDRQRVVARTASSIDVEVKGTVSSTKLSAARRKELLQATPYEAIDDERIVGTAKRIIDGAPTDMEKVRRLTEFVYGHVERKSMDRGYAPAVSTLDSKAGDCTEHSVLLSALLRSIGLPTRIIDGIIVDGTQAGYHEWVEVFIDGKGFMPVDPTFNAWPAGAERLKLAEGTSHPSEQLQLSLAAARLLSNKVKLRVVAAQ